MIPGKQYSPEILLRVAWRLKWLIVIPALTVATAVVLYTRTLPNRYKSDAVILVVPQRVPESYVRPTVTMRIEDRLQSISQQIMSRTRIERIIQDFNLYADRRKTEILEDVVDRMRWDISMDVVKGDAFRVSYTSDSARTAMLVTERLASLFIDESLRDREALAEGTEQFIEAQLDAARRKLIENEKRLEEYRRKHDGQLPTQLGSNLEVAHNTQMQVQALLDSINRDRDRQLVLERSIEDATMMEIQPVVPSITSPTGEIQPSTVDEQLRLAQAQLRAMEMRLTSQHPDVIRMKRTIADLEKLAGAQAAQRPVSDDVPVAVNPAEIVRKNRLTEAKAELDKLVRDIKSKEDEELRLRGVIADYQKRIEAAPTRESELTDLTRDYSTIQGLYQSLLAKKQESQIAANLERRQIGEQFRILDPARLPGKPYSPDRPRIYGLGFAFALAVGIGLAAIAEYLDRSMRSEDDVRAVLNLPVLASIPLIQPRGGRRISALAASLMVGAVAVTGAVVIVWRMLR